MAKAKECYNHSNCRWKVTKVEVVAVCNECRSPWCIYSASLIRSTGDQPKQQSEDLQQQIVYGYVCGEAVGIDKLGVNELIF